MVRCEHQQREMKGFLVGQTEVRQAFKDFDAASDTFYSAIYRSDVPIDLAIDAAEQALTAARNLHGVAWELTELLPHFGFTLRVFQRGGMKMIPVMKMLLDDIHNIVGPRKRYWIEAT